MFLLFPIKRFIAILLIIVMKIQNVLGYFRIFNSRLETISIACSLNCNVKHACIHKLQTSVTEKILLLFIQLSLNRTNSA